MQRIGLLAVALLGCLCLSAAAADADDAYDHWVKLPYPPGRAEYFGDIGLEKGDVLWVIAGTTIAYWDGQQFRLPKDFEFVSGFYFQRFYGGSEGGLYSFRWRSGGPVEVHRLSDGRAVHVTDIDWGLPRNPQSFYASRSGKLFTWDKTSLALFTGLDWEKMEAALDTPQPLVFDNGRDVWFFHDGRLYGVAASGRVWGSKLSLEFRDPFSGSRPTVNGALWGGDRAIFLAYGGREIKAASLATGALIDTVLIGRAFGGRDVWDAFSSPDGSVWVLASDKELQSHVFMRIGSDGRVERITAAAGLHFNNHQFSYSPKSAMFASDGAAWFGLYEAPLVRMQHGRLRQFAGTGLDLSGCTKLLEDSRGRIYALTSHGVYVTAAGSLGSFDRLPAPRPPTTLKGVAWKLEPGEYALLKTARIGPERIVLGSPNSDGLWFFDADTGEKTATLEIAGFNRMESWLAPGIRPDQVLVVAPKRILVVDTAKPQVERQIDWPVDPRVAPVPAGGGFFAAKGYRSSELVLLDREGNEQWTCKVSGYVQSQLTACGAFGAVQTRGSSYGGQKTIGIDLNTGKVLWSDTTDAYGYGAVFDDDAEYLVEADMWLSPPATEGRLIGREVRTGEQRWQFAKAGTISHCPALDPKTDRVYAVFDRGEVVCLDGPTGELVWESATPEGPYPAASPSYDPTWSAIALVEDCVLVVDRQLVLHVFRARDGQRVASFDLASVLRDPQRRYLRPIRLLCMPRFEGRLLLVASDRILAAYRIGDASARP